MISVDKLFEVIRASQKPISLGFLLHRVDIRPIEDKKEVSLAFRKDLSKEKGEKIIIVNI